jgi:hypothetical protein
LRINQSKAKQKAGNKMIKVIRLPRRERERHTHKCNLQSTKFKTFGTKTDSQYSSAQLYNKITKRHYLNLVAFVYVYYLLSISYYTNLGLPQTQLNSTGMEIMNCLEDPNKWVWPKRNL